MFCCTRGGLMRVYLEYSQLCFVSIVTFLFCVPDQCLCLGGLGELDSMPEFIALCRGPSDRPACSCSSEMCKVCSDPKCVNITS